MIKISQKTFKLYLLRSAFLLVVSLLFSLGGCIPQKKLNLMQIDRKLIDSLYYRNDSSFSTIDSIYRIQPNDYIYIKVQTVQKELSEFLEPITAVNYISSSNQALTGYVVTPDGYISIPYMGKIYIKGKTIKYLENVVQQKARQYLNDPQVIVRLINNNITILGETIKQGVFQMGKTKISIYEAIALANGFDTYADRSELKVYRHEASGEKLYLVDLTRDAMQSNVFYVYPNDVIVVDAMRAKMFGITPEFSLSILTSVISLYILVTNL